MKRRAARQTAQREDTGMQLIRVRVEDVYGGMIAARAQADDTLAPLAASIARHGMLQPIVVRANSRVGRYALVCGARRLAACRLLGLTEIDALCLTLDDAAAAACFMEEHLTRVLPGPLEEARAMQAADTQAVQADFALEAAQIERRLALLKLPQSVQHIVQEKGLTLEQAQPLLLAAGEARQTEAALIIAERALTPAQARRLVLGPARQQDEAGAGRRRAVRLALGEVSRIAERMRAQGVETSVTVHSQEGGLCVQLLFAHGEKNAGQQEFWKKGRKEQLQYACKKTEC